MKTFLTALALILVMEGIGFALFPGLVREGLREMLKLSDAGLRALGIMALVGSILLALFTQLVYRA